jgi:bacteriocin biosynthesis cyclodehydratase domain-containing protein
LPDLLHPEQSVLFHYGREFGVVLEDVDETQMRLLSLLDGQHTFHQLVTLLQRTDPAVTAEEVSEALDHLTHLGLLEDASVEPPDDFTSAYLERYESQLRTLSALDSTGTQKYALQAKLKASRVTVLGLGGLGCNVLQGLAALGVGFLRGVDFDCVERGNLNRQVLYDVSNIGMPKTQAAAEQLARFNPEVLFEPVQRKMTGPRDIIELIQGSDLVAFCADRPRGILLWMNQAALEAGIPFIAAGYHGFIAEVGPLVIPYKTDCLQCLLGGSSDPGEIAELAWIEAAFWLHHPNIHFVTALSAHLICSEICKYLTGIGRPATYNAIYALDLGQFTLTSQVLPRSTTCSACGRTTSALPSLNSEQQKAEATGS